MPFKINAFFEYNGPVFVKFGIYLCAKILWCTPGIIFKCGKVQIVSAKSTRSVGRKNQHIFKNIGAFVIIISGKNGVFSNRVNAGISQYFKDII